MHRKDTELLGRTIGARRRLHSGFARHQTPDDVIITAAIDEVAKDICRVFKQQNPNFYDDLFIRLCGIPS